MASVIKPKRSAVANTPPTTANIQQYEIAINTADKKIYTRDGTDNILVIGAGNVSGLADVALSSLADTQILSYNAATSKWINIDNYATQVKEVVKNSTGATLTKGTVVYVSGATGANILVAKAQANAEITSSRTFGILEADIANGATGYCIRIGKLTGLDTSAYAEGDPIYLSPTTAGGFVVGFANKPSAPNHLVYLGVVTRSQAINGEIQVSINNGWELDEIHDVQIGTKASGNTLIYDATAGTWKNASLTAGTDISVTNGAGSITIADTSTLASVTGRGATTSSAISITNSTASSSTSTGALTVTGGVGVGGNLNAGGNITASTNLISTYSAGDEGGEIQLAKPQTNNTLAGAVSIDIYQNKLRIFENGGTARGVYIDLTAAAAGVATNLMSGGGTVTSVGLTVPTGLSVSGSPVTGSGTLAISLQTGYSIPTTASQTNWDTAYTDRNKWDGGATGLTASTGRTSLGATTVGSNLFTLTNPSAITFLRVNADNTVSALDAATFRTAIGAGTSSTTGTVTSVGGTGTVAGLSLSGTVTTSGNLTLSGTLSTPVSTINDSTTVGQNLVKLTNPSAVTFLRVNADNTVSALSAASFLTAIGAQASGSYLTANQTITLSGDVTGSGSTAITATLSNSGVTAGTYSLASITVDSKGRITAASSGSVTSLIGTTSSSAPYTVALGQSAGTNSTGTGNIAIGYQALDAGNSGGYGIAIGYNAASSATTSTSFVAIGLNAMLNPLSGGAYGVYIGESAGRSITSGSSHVAIGYNAGYSMTSSNADTVVGYNALSSYSGPQGTNVAIGANAGSSLTAGGNNIIIGESAQASSTTVSNEITLGNASITKLRVPGVGFYVGTESIASAATITPDSTDSQYNITALATDATLAAPAAGKDGQQLRIRIKDNGTARAITWTTSSGGYRAIGTTLFTSTVAGKTIYVGCIYNAADSFWDVVSVSTQA